MWPRIAILAFAVAFSTIWAASRFYAFNWIPTERLTCYFQSDPSHLVLVKKHSVTGRLNPGVEKFRAQPLNAVPATHLRWPIDTYRSVSYTLYGVAHWLIVAPLWLLVYFFPPRRFRKFKGLCNQCGYNLNGNQSGKCPECGTPIAHIDNDETAEATSH